jgi:hypothetical protein
VKALGVHEGRLVSDDEFRALVVAGARETG